MLEKEEHVSSSKREDNVSLWKREEDVSTWKKQEDVSTWKREVHVNIWKREETVQTKCKQSQSTVPNLLSSHHWQKANNQIHCTRSAQITSLTKKQTTKSTVPDLLTSHHWQKTTTTKTTVPNLLTSHHWQKTNNQNYCTISCLHHITDKKQTKNNNPKKNSLQNYNSYLYVYL